MELRPASPGRSWRFPTPTTFPAAALRRLLGVPVRVVVVTITAGLLAASCGGGDPAALQNIPGTTQQQMITDRNDPAVLLILTDYSATISVPTLGYNNAALNALGNQIVAEAESGQIGSDQKSLADALVAGVAQNPGAYFTADPPVVQQNVSLEYQCTGSIVTPDGYLVTAAHCTQVPSDQLAQDYVQQGLQPMLNAAVQQFLANNPGFDSDQQQKLSNAVAAYLTSQAQFSNQTETYSAAMFSSTSNGNRQAVATPLSLITQGNAPPSQNGPFGDKDVSILKLNGYNSLPTLPVGSDTSIDAGQQLYVLGYPAAATAGNQNLQNIGTPTLSAGLVSAEKTSNQGVPLIETTQTITGGDSGGPGFGQDGVMIGIVSYGGSGYNYLIGGSVVQEFLHEKNIQPRQSLTTTLYDTALNDYYRHYYKRALPEFQQVKGLDPSNPYVDLFIQKTDTAILEGLDQTPPLSLTAILLLALAAGALIVLAGCGLSFFIIRRRRRSRRVPSRGGVQAPPPVVGAAGVTGQPDGPPGYGRSHPVATGFQAQHGTAVSQVPATPPAPQSRWVTLPTEAPPYQPQPPATQPQPPPFQRPAPSYPTTPAIGFTAPATPPAATPGYQPETAPVRAPASPVPPPPFAPPPGWAWDGSQFIPMEHSDRDSSGRLSQPPSR